MSDQRLLNDTLLNQDQAILVLLKHNGKVAFITERAKSLLGISSADDEANHQNSENSDYIEAPQIEDLSLQEFSQLASFGDAEIGAESIFEVDLSPELAAEPVLGADPLAPTDKLIVKSKAIEWQGQAAFLLTLSNQELAQPQTSSKPASRAKTEPPPPIPPAKTGVFNQIEAENRLILNAAGEGIYGVDAQGNTTFVNPAAERILGWLAKDLVGKNIHEAIHHSHGDGSHYCAAHCPIYAAFKDGAVHKVDNEFFWTKTGEAIAVEYTSTPIWDQGQLVGAVVVFSDISDRKRAEQQLHTALHEVKQLKQQLEMENAYLQEEISAGYSAYQLVGNSPGMKAIIEQIQLVAPTTATVLINGESGTGKELIARAIHTASERSSRALVRVNCAAIPADLFESEFFGHVRGAFSGALQDRLGRFQVANGGTLFLDEVGEIPLALQGKLLRVLQDQEFERVGDSTTQTVDVRVIAATNKDLKSLVDQGLFREDLYYRLNVFPVKALPLRERKEDIPLLISHFLKKTCQQFNRSELKISLAQIQTLKTYNWPGNIRELENYIERQVILSRGEKLVLDLRYINKNGLIEPLRPNSDQAQQTTSRDIHQYSQVDSQVDNEIDSQIDFEGKTEEDCQQIIYQATVSALERCKGKIYGEDGAAKALGLKPTTLSSRLKKLGINRRDYA